MSRAALLPELRDALDHIENCVVRTVLTKTTTDAWDTICLALAAQPDVQSEQSTHHREHLLDIDRALERIGVRLLYADDGSLARATKEPAGGLSLDQHPSTTPPCADGNAP